MGRVDELEGSKQKITARLGEAEETIESLNQKITATEKTKHRLETELDDLQMEYERERTRVDSRTWDLPGPDLGYPRSAPISCRLRPIFPICLMSVLILILPPPSLLVLVSLHIASMRVMAVATLRCSPCPPV